MEEIKKHNSDESIKDLITNLGDEDGMIRLHARQKLVHRGDSAVKELIEAFQQTNDFAHFEAAKALSQIGSIETIDCFTKAFEDEEFRVRWVAAEGLIAIGRDSIIPVLELLKKSSNIIWIREGVHHVILDLIHKNLINKEEKELLQKVVDTYTELGTESSLLNAAKNALEKL